MALTWLSQPFLECTQMHPFLLSLSTALMENSRLAVYVAFRNNLVHCTFRPECSIKPYTCKSRSLHGLRYNKFNPCGWVTSLKCYIQLLVTCTWKVCHKDYNFMSKLNATLSFKFECFVDWQWLVPCITVIRPNGTIFPTVNNLQLKMFPLRSQNL